MSDERDYIKGKIYGLPKPARDGWETSPDKPIGSEHIYEVTIKNIPYFKVHFKRMGKSKIKYFKTFNDAKTFVEMLRINKYL